MSTREARGRWASRAVQALFLVSLIALWAIATSWGQINKILLPAPLPVFYELVDVIKTGEYIGDLAVTLTELAAAFMISAVAGTMVGFLVSRSPYAIKVFEPLMASAYSVPLILFLPLYILFFGLGEPSKIALGATISFFPVALNTIAGFGNIERIFTVSARSMGASNYQLFRYVLLPAALPVILTGLRMGFTVALLAILGSETIASLAGIGHRIAMLSESMDMAHMFAYIAFAIAIAAFLNAVVSSLEARGRR